ncbi:MAG: uroporphyrinogen decarboxylase family protein [Armatimonadota bacterium]
MDRKYYLDLAEKGLTMPIAADLVLHDYLDAEEILLDGKRLGQVLAETAHRFNTPLAVPHMDLELEKKALLSMIGIAPDEMAKFHFDSAPSSEDFETVRKKLKERAIPESQAQFDAITYIDTNTELFPIGMSIGPFSLMTKLVSDPITPVCLAGTGMTAEDDKEIALVESVLDFGMLIIMHNIQKQIDAGAMAIFVAEPAANKVYFSPNQIESGSDIFERYVMTFNQRMKNLMDANGVDLIFHCCGELTDYMVSKFAELDSAILSLGSSRKLWEDASLVPKTTVLFGNLPSKQFYSDDLITADQVIERGHELVEKMRRIGHPFILGSECDILSVPGCCEAIMSKAEAITQSTESTPCLAAVR